MAAPNVTGLGCAAALVAIVGFFGYRIYDGYQRMIGLDDLLASARAGAAAERMSPSLSADLAGVDQAAPFGKTVSGFLAAPLTRDVFPSGPSEPNRFKAPVAVVDLDGRKIDQTQGRLPASARARDIRSARTLVFVRCFKGDKVGEYGFLQGAYRRNCDLIGFDMKTPGGPTMLAATNFQEEPPESVSTAEIWRAFHDVVADRPASAMALYITDNLASR